MTAAPLLEMRGISKRFPGVVALDSVSLQMTSGEVVALVGENGAGKSTLMKILGGVHQPDAGEILLDGRPVKIHGVNDAIRLGIAFIHQELNVLDNLDVAANVFLGREPVNPLGLVNRRKIYADTGPFLKRLGLEVSPRTRLDQLSLAHQQMVEIAKALSLNARLIIMDEPTSSLTLAETKRLLELVRELAQQVVVLRDGSNAGELTHDEATHDRLVNLMVGREIKNYYVQPEGQKAAGFFKVRNAHSSLYPRKAVSFDAARGEILGFAGLVGAGRSEIAKAIVGLDASPPKEVILDGKQVPIATPRDAIEQGICLVPENRRTEGLVVEMSIRENVSLPSLPRFSQFGLIQGRREREAAAQQVDSLKVKTPTTEQLARQLSGGNQQKVVLAKWLGTSPRILLMDEPTRGIDVGAKAEIYRIMRTLAGQGTVILMISSDMEEILNVSDRIAVMHEGEITGVLERADCNEQNVMQLAIGKKIPAAQPAFQ
jgi:ribose transport system ATP-binding protein